MMGPIKLFPSSTIDQFLEATKFKKYVPSGFDSNRQVSSKIGIPDKGYILKGFPWRCFYLCPSLDNRMGNL